MGQSQFLYSGSVKQFITVSKWIEQIKKGVELPRKGVELPQITEPVRDILITFPEGPIKVLTSGTSKRPSADSWGTNTKIDDLMKKVFLRLNSLCFTHILLLFTEKKY